MRIALDMISRLRTILTVSTEVYLAEKGRLIRKHDVAHFMISVDPIEGDKGNKDGTVASIDKAVRLAP